MKFRSGFHEIARVTCSEAVSAKNQFYENLITRYGLANELIVGNDYLSNGKMRLDCCSSTAQLLYWEHY